MKIGTKLCVHCGCIVAQFVGNKWLCAKCGLETTPADEQRFRELKRPPGAPKPSQN